MENQELIPHLFRTEFRKITAVLCKLFGSSHLEQAEDIASETFLAALENWTFQGVPENPVAWLYTVAKNKARNYLHRTGTYQHKVLVQLKYALPDTEQFALDLSEGNITDSQLQMLFAVCHPGISAKAQVGLALRILCGFGIDEIATAFLTNRETINKRLYRAREKLREAAIAIEFPPPAEIEKRLESVLTTLYLLFSEGYYSESADSVVRAELCMEAIRLTHLLLEYEPTCLPQVNALLALEYFQASRLDARISETGEPVRYADQDISRWNEGFISNGAYYLNRASGAASISSYHLEAAIAYWYTVKNDSVEKWQQILSLFDQLLEIKYSPVTALNRIYAYAKVYSGQAAIIEAEKLNFTTSHFYYLLLGDLYTGIDNQKASYHLEKAYSLARSVAEQKTIRKKIDLL